MKGSILSTRQAHAFLLSVVLLFIIISVSGTQASYQENSHFWQWTQPDVPRHAPFALHIADVRLAAEPVVGREVDMEVEITSTAAVPDVTLDLSLPEQVELVQGELQWRGSIAANQVYVHHVTIKVVEAGEHQVGMGLLSPSSGASSYVDGVSFFIRSSETEAPIIRDYEYEITQAEFRVKETEDASRFFAPGEVEVAAAGMITIEGQVTYEAEIGDCHGSNLCASLVTGLVPENAIIELWDVEPGGERLLAESQIGASGPNAGRYSFTVPNNDPDGTGIDPLIKIYSTDGVHVEVVNTSEGLYIHALEMIPDRPDGLHVRDINMSILDPSTGASGQVFYIFDTIANDGYGYLQQQVGWSNNELVQVNWPQGCVFGLVENACYFEEQIYVPLPQGVQTDVILHEYGHFVLSRDVGNLAVFNACAPEWNHLFGEASISSACAWSEGWADFFEMAVQGTSDYRGVDVEAPARLPTTRGDHATYWESLVAAVLWDIFDGANEPFDVINDGFNGTGNGIWSISTTHMTGSNFTSGYQAFFSEWSRLHGRTGICSLSAQYNNMLYELTLNPVPSAGGFIYHEPLEDCSGNRYVAERELLLQAEPSGQYEFIRWDDDAALFQDTNPIVEFFMFADSLATARFDLISTPTLTPSPTPSPTSTPTNTPTATPTPSPTASPTPQTRTFMVAQSSDDAGVDPSCSFSTGWNEIYLGQCTNGQPITSGFRFTNVPIPSGSQITHAYLEFTVDGTYTASIAVTFAGENSGDAQPFSGGNRPDDRALTNAATGWSVTDTWTLGDVHTGPDLTAIIQEVVDRSDWNSGNALAIITTDTGSTANEHRRVIGYDRIDPRHGYNGPDHAARLVVTYIEGNSPPPTPLPTATNTPTLTPTPQPCNCVFNCDDTGNGTANAPHRHGIGVLASLSQVADLADFAGLLYRLRDGVLSQTEAGQRYIDLYYDHSAEIATILLADPDLYDQGYTALQSLAPTMAALLNDNGDEVTITAEQVRQAQNFLDALSQQAGPDLQQTIIAEQARRPLDRLIGLTVKEAWTYLNGYTLTWRPPLDGANPYEAQRNRTIPVKFRVEDMEGAFVRDPDVTLRLLDEAGAIVVGPVGLADNPNEGITVNGEQYHYNLRTRGLAPGTYLLQVSYNSVAGQPSEKTIILRKK